MSLGLTRKQSIMITILIGGASLSILNQTAVSPMLPSIMGQMSVSSATAQWLVSGYTMVMAIFVPVSAYLMNRFTTRKIFFVAIAMFLVGCLLCVLAPNFPVLLVGRCLQGGCAGIMMPLATAVMLLVFPMEKRGTAMGIYSLITMLMPAIGPAITGFLTDMAGWRVIFFAMLALAIAFAIVAVFALSNYGETEDVRLDIPSVIISSFGLISLLYGTSELGNQGFSVTTISAIVCGIVLIAAFALRQIKIASPLLNLRVFKYSHFTIGLCILMAIQLLVNANAVIMPLVIQQSMGESASATGLVTLPGALVGAVAALVAGKFFDRFGPRIIAFIGSLIVCSGYIGFAFIDQQSSLVIMASFNVLCTVGLLCITTPLNTWSLGFLPDELIPHGNAVSNTLRQVAGAVGTAILVSLMSLISSSAQGSPAEASMIGAHVVYVVIATSTFLIAACILFFVHGKPGAETSPSSLFPDAQSLAAADSLSIPENTIVREALQLFNAAGTTDAPIVDHSGNVVAFLSVGDVLKRLGASAAQASLIDFYSYLPEVSENGKIATEQEKMKELMTQPVISLATKKVITVSASATFKEVCQVLSERRIKKVPVIDSDGSYVGTINRKDIVNRMLAELADSLT